MANTVITDNRWYDQMPRTSTAINLLLMFPDDIQEILGQSISALAEARFDVESLIGNLKSLGTEKVLSLYKSEAKRRSYDHLPGMHKAMNYLSIMPQENREVLVANVRELTNCVSQYLQMCQANHREATIKEIDQLATTYVQNGLYAARYFIKRIENNELRRQPMSKTEEFADTEAMRITFKEEI